MGVHLWEDPILPIMRLLKELQRGERLERPENEACSDEMCAILWSVTCVCFTH